MFYRHNLSQFKEREQIWSWYRFIRFCMCAKTTASISQIANLIEIAQAKPEIYVLKVHVYLVF